MFKLLNCLISRNYLEDILLKQFDQMQQLMKQMTGKGKKRKLPGKMGGFPGFPGM